ncbi:glycoside hydrolase family 47 protein, partial [Ephemerocybe angulata]
ADLEKRDAIVGAFKHAWHAYERDAMGSDEYHPISHGASNLTEAGSIGYMVVDVLDSLQIMGLDEEYQRARTWVENVSFDVDGEYSTFETTIRVLGGLLSAYHLSGNDELYLQKAIDLADRLSVTFDSPTGLPYPYVNLHAGTGHHAKDYPGLVSAAEVGTLQLEFKYLSHVTGDPKYWRSVEKVMTVLKNALLEHNLASVFMNHLEGRYIHSPISLGSRADSYYEYLLKQYIQTNKTEEIYGTMYRGAMDSVQQFLIQVRENKDGQSMTYTSEMMPEQDPSGQISWRLTPKQDHLVCFLGGSLMLGAVKSAAFNPDRVSMPPEESELNDYGWKDWKTGKELIKTCLKTHDTATGLSPEIVYFRIASDGMDAYEWAPTDWYIRGAQPGVPPPYDARYMLRPETVESLFIAYRLTGDELYREHGWRIFQSIEKHAKVSTGGYATVLNVDENPARLEDKMETFFLSETLKYLYLLFSDSDVLPFDKYVFNTEAHPLPIFTPKIPTAVF